MKPLDQTRLEAALRAVEAAGEVTENTIRRAITAYTATLPGGEPPGCPTPGACSCREGDIASASRKLNAETERLRTRYHEAIAKAIDKIEAADNMTAAAEARALAAERERDEAREALERARTTMQDVSDRADERHANKHPAIKYGIDFGGTVMLRQELEKIAQWHDEQAALLSPLRSIPANAKREAHEESAALIRSRTDSAREQEGGDRGE